MPLEKGSLVLVDYTARVKDTNEVFETTREEDAKKRAELYDPTRKYEPRLVSVGEAHDDAVRIRHRLEARRDPLRLKEHLFWLMWHYWMRADFEIRSSRCPMRTEP